MGWLGVLFIGLSLLPAKPVSAKARLRLQLVDEQTEKALPGTLEAGKGLVHFVHIPKTGGSSFGTVIKRYLGARYVSDAFLAEKDKADGTGIEGCSPLAADKSAPCAATVHQGTPTCPFLVGCVLSHAPRMQFAKDERAVSLTVLRQPVNRTLSAFFHGWPHTPDSTHGCGKPPTCLRLWDYVALPAYRNVAVRMLGNDSKPYETEVVGQAHLDAALENIRSMDFVGLSEAFRTTLKLAFVSLGWGLGGWTWEGLMQRPSMTECGINQQKEWCHDMAGPNNKEHYNRARGRVGRNATLRGRMLEFNALDHQLWAAAADMFCAKLAEHKAEVYDDDPVVQAELAKAGLCTDVIKPQP